MKKIKKIKTSVEMVEKNIFGNIFNSIVVAEDEVINLENIFSLNQNVLNENNLKKAKCKLLDLQEKRNLLETKGGH